MKCQKNMLKLALGAVYANKAGMFIEEVDLEIAAARESVLRWLKERTSGWYESNAQVAEAFVREVAEETDLELRTVRNPSACVYEARWYHGGREAEEFRKPFSADEEADARVLACAAMLKLN